MNYPSIIEHAKSIFTVLVQDVGPNYWDWQPVATKALEAAEAFDVFSEQRYGLGAAFASEPAAQASIEVQHPTPPKPQHSDAWPWQYQQWPPT